MDVLERYVRLCLRAGRHVEDLVDAYVGPSAWASSIAGEGLVDPKRLRDEAHDLLESLRDADVEDVRRRWLRAQLEALACITARLSGEEIAWADEVERCLGVRPRRTDVSVLEDVHRRLDAALPGHGTLRERYTAWDENDAVPWERIVPALERLTDVLRPRAHELAPLPEESVTYELVSDVPWIAYNRFEGHGHSRIEVNASLPVSVVLLVTLAAHEAYPGHHAERTAKEARLYHELGRVETSVAIAPAPESVVSEGIGQIALEQALGPEPFEAVAEILGGMHLRFDPAGAAAIGRAEAALYDVAVNVAFMLHEDGVSTDEAEDYIRTWGLESDEKAARTVAFLTDAGSRAYVSAYPDGERLCRTFVARSAGDFARLLTEQLTVSDLTT